MERLLPILTSIDNSLKIIAKSLQERNALISSEKFKVNEQDAFIDNELLTTIHEELTESIQSNRYNLNSALFKELTNVYLDEEIERIRSGKSKKSSRRVSVNLGSTLESFFANYLKIPELKVERIKEGGLLVFSVNDEVFATMKYMTDLGYSRGEAFYETVDHIIATSRNLYNLEVDDVYIIVSSLTNGIDKSFVETTLGHEIDSNLDFLTNRSLVNQFLVKYLNGLSRFTESNKNVYFLASELHPNVTANDLLNDELNSQDVLEAIENYTWFSSIEELIQNLEEKAKMI